MIKEFQKINFVEGELQLPGDKSVSHRSVMFSSLAEGESVVYNCLESADINSTIDCFRKMGIEIDKNEERIIIRGKGLYGLQAPREVLDCGNSGTTARLISGILAAQKFESTLIGDESLSRRPMKRVIDPLREMGAIIETNEKLTLPMTIKPSPNFHAINYTLPVASAQVKSCVLLAGLFLEETTRVIEKEPTRNHTENLLNLDVEEKDEVRIISINNKKFPKPSVYYIPSDISASAFFIVLASLLKGSVLTLKNILLNETRNGIITVMKKMGADITIVNKQTRNGEISGDIIVRGAALENCEIDKEIIPNIIDEIPVLAIAGIFAGGAFEIRNAHELRVKEADRISAMCNNLKLLGLNITEYDDGFRVEGEIKNFDNLLFESYGDHRIAMAFGVLSVILPKGGRVNNFECVEISNPNFANQIEKIARG